MVHQIHVLEAQMRKPTIWLTRDYIKAAATESPEAALACSIKHHRQIKNATAKELREGFTKELVSYGDDHCSLCHRYRTEEGWSDCGKCPLGPSKCCLEYHEANDALAKWEERKAPIAPFRRAAGRLIAKMVRIQKGAKT